MSKTKRIVPPKSPRVGWCAWVPPDEQPHPIPPEKLAKNPARRFCCMEHAVLWRHKRGDFHRMSKRGNASQAAFKTATGAIPHYEKRAGAVAASNRAHPRRLLARRKKEQAEGIVMYREGDHVEVLLSGVISKLYGSEDVLLLVDGAGTEITVLFDQIVRKTP